MRLTFAFVTTLVAAVRAQDFNFDAILDAPSPSLTQPPVGAVSASSFSVNSAVASASIASEVSTAASAIASAAQPSIAGRRLKGNWWPTTTWHHKSPSSSPCPTTSSNKHSSSSTSPPVTTQPTTSSSTSGTSSSTSSSTSACPTTPEPGTYCGFINPEDPCAPQPDGYGPHVEPDTVAAFEAYPPFHADALNAQTPSGYAEVFTNLNASVSANSYLTFYTLKSYDVAGCANYCDNTDLCTAFNIWIERDPSLNPTKNASSNATWCPDPASITNYKCSLWGSNINAGLATNYGQYREDFDVVIVGSNGYDKTNSTTPSCGSGWNPPHNCGSYGIGGASQWCLGSHFYPGPFNPSLCSWLAEAQTAKNKEAAIAASQKSYTPVNSFNAYMVHKNGVPQGTYCSLFDVAIDPKFATWAGAWASNDYFGVGQSWTFEQEVQDNGAL